MKKYVKSTISNTVDIDSYKKKMEDLINYIQLMASRLPKQCDNMFNTIPTRLEAIEKHDSLMYTKATFGNNGIEIDHYCEVIINDAEELWSLYHECEDALGLWDVDKSLTDEDEMDKILKERWGD